MLNIREITPEQMARRFHEYYELLAPTFGWETHKDCKVEFESLPKANQQLMIAVCKNMLEWMQRPQYCTAPPIPMYSNAEKYTGA